MQRDQRTRIGRDTEKRGVRERIDARIADDEIEAASEDAADGHENEQIEDIAEHHTLALLPNRPEGRARMKANRITKATASLQPVESFHTARLSARPRISPPKTAPRKDPMPPMMLAAIEISTTR